MQHTSANILSPQLSDDTEISGNGLCSSENELSEVDRIENVPILDLSRTPRSPGYEGLAPRYACQLVWRHSYPTPYWTPVDHTALAHTSAARKWGAEFDSANSSVSTASEI